MAEELQHLIDRIRTDAFDRAQEESESLLARAKQEATEIRRAAEVEAEERLAQAEREAAVYTERSENALAQAARDVLIEVEQALGVRFQKLVDEKVDEVLDPDLLKKMVLALVDAYTAREGRVAGLEILLGKEDRQALMDYFKGALRKQMEEGLQLGGDDQLGRGFRVSFEGDSAYHDFSRPAIAEALGRFVRPGLRETLRKAAEGAGG